MHNIFYIIYINMTFVEMFSNNEKSYILLANK